MLLFVDSIDLILMVNPLLRAGQRRTKCESDDTGVIEKSGNENNYLTTEVYGGSQSAEKRLRLFYSQFQS